MYMGYEKPLLTWYHKFPKLYRTSNWKIVSHFKMNTGLVKPYLFLNCHVGMQVVASGHSAYILHHQHASYKTPWTETTALAKAALNVGCTYKGQMDGL